MSSKIEITKTQLAHLRKSAREADQVFNLLDAKKRKRASTKKTTTKKTTTKKTKRARKCKK